MDTSNPNNCASDNRKIETKDYTPKKSISDAIISKEKNARSPIDQRLVTDANGFHILKERYLLSPTDCATSSHYKCVDIYTKETFLCKTINESYDRVALAYFRLDQTIDGDHQPVQRLHDIHALSKDRTTIVIAPPKFGNLHSYIRDCRHICESEARNLFRQMCAVVEKCHHSGVILRDLKLRKFYFSNHDRTMLQYESLEGAVVLDDMNDDTLTEKIGCPLYVAPEVITQNTTYGGKAADMWALGVLLYTMLVGQYPFNDVNGQALFSKILGCNYHIPQAVSSKARCLIRSLLRRNPDERLTVDDVSFHPWFKDNDSNYIGLSNYSKNKDQLVPEAIFFDEDMT